MQRVSVNAIGPSEPVSRPVRVWDLLVRVFHWTTVVGVLVAFLTDEWRQAHLAVGYIVMGAVVVRVIWGFVGSVHARFDDFVPGPRRLWRYGQSMMQLREPRHLGHNPAGGAMVMALLLTLILVSLSGWMMTWDAFWGEEWLEETHEFFTNVLLLLVPLHVLGVIWSSYRHRENLVKAMVTGDKAEVIHS